jgi:hypothetical protein
MSAIWRRRPSIQRARQLRSLTKPIISVGTCFTPLADEHQPAVSITLDDLPLTHVRVGSASADRRHASLNHAQRLTRRSRVVFFGFFDGLSSVARRSRHSTDAPVQRQAIRILKWYVGFDNGLFLVLGSSVVCHHPFAYGVPPVQIAARSDGLRDRTGALLRYR